MGERALCVGENISSPLSEEKSLRFGSFLSGEWFLFLVREKRVWRGLSVFKKLFLLLSWEVMPPNFTLRFKRSISTAHACIGLFLGKRRRAKFLKRGDIRGKLFPENWLYGKPYVVECWLNFFALPWPNTPPSTLLSRNDYFFVFFFVSFFVPDPWDKGKRAECECLLKSFFQGFLRLLLSLGNLGPVDGRPWLPTYLEKKRIKKRIN